jgi:pimeloyl-ACP methyl ester carboxylesterase
MPLNAPNCVPPAPSRFSAVKSAAMQRMFAAVMVLCVSACAVVGPDYAREQRWADEIVPGLVVGDAARLETASKRSFLGIFADSAKSRGAIILMHGSGVHPDFAIVGQLRSLLNDAGFTTLSIQMPVLAADAQAEDYPGVFAQANERIAAAIEYLRAKKQGRIAIVSHSMGARMALDYLKRYPGAPLAAWVPLAISDGDLKGLPLTAFPVFDVYAERDFEVVLARKNDRAAALREVPGSKQVMVFGADHFFAGREREVAMLLGDLLGPVLQQTRR